VENFVENSLPVENLETKILFHTFPQARFFLSLWKCGKLCLSIDSKTEYSNKIVISPVEKNPQNFF
jgi:hypothetical protein